MAPQGWCQQDRNSVGCCSCSEVHFYFSRARSAMPQIKMPLVLDLPTPLTRRRQRARIAAGLMAGLLAIPLALLVIPAPRIAPTLSTDNLLPDDVALTETIPALVVGAAIIAEPSMA